MRQLRASRLGPVPQALLVTFLWSTSFILVKIGLKDIPALPFAGLRYAMAFGFLLSFVVRRRRLAWIFLEERLAWREVAGMLVAAIGVAIVQLPRRRV